MQGTILHYSNETGTGHISGDDGERYSFSPSDLKELREVEQGMRVDFRADGESAQEIFFLGGKPAKDGAGQLGDLPEGHPSLRYGLGPIGFFKKCVGMYVNAEGRATVAEYWSFCLVQLVLYVVLAFVFGFVAGMFAGPSADVETVGMIAGTVGAGLAMLALALPGICVTIRRLHDIGLTGWLVLTAFIPYVGSLFLLVCTLIPSQSANKHGPKPKEYLAAHGKG